MHLLEDIRAYKHNDPAARSVAEVLLLYNGLHATIDYRIAHWLHIHRLHFLARAISQWSKMWTGIEIHPGAKIGRRLVIDHGTGIVANAVVLREVPDNATVVGVPGRIVRLSGEKLDHIHTPDPVMLEITALQERIARLEKRQDAEAAAPKHEKP